MYLGTADRGVVAVDMESLELLWTFETGRSLIYTSPYSNGDVATVDNNGKVTGIAEGTAVITVRRSRTRDRHLVRASSSSSSGSSVLTSIPR